MPTVSTGQDRRLAPGGPVQGRDPDLLAPWDAGTTLVAGGECGHVAGEGAHLDFGDRWTDDRFAIDFGICGGSDYGLPVRAAHGGVVRRAGWDPDYGWTVIVERARDDIATRYAHLAEEPPVSRGSDVDPGEVIGAIGHSGNGGGSREHAHLHFVAYNGRGRHDGHKILRIAGQAPCDGCLVESQTYLLTDQTVFTAQILGVVPREETITLVAGRELEIGFDIDVGRPFDSARFVLEPKPSDVMERLAPHEVRGVPGATSTIGSFRTMIRARDDSPPADELLRWDLVDRATGQRANVLPRIALKIEEAPHKTRPCTPSGTTTGIRPASSTFSATLDDQFPDPAADQHIHLVRGQVLDFGFNVRFNQRFRADAFVLRPRTPETIDRLVESRATPNNDLYGFVAPNDDAVGYYRARFEVRDCIEDGAYLVQWDVINNFNDEYANLQPSFKIVVESS